MPIFSNALCKNRTPFKKNNFIQLFSILYITLWIFCWFNNQNLENFIIENLLIIILLPSIIWSYHKYIFSDMSYFLLFIYLLLHMYGSYYAYTDAAFGEWLKEIFHLQRNPYDRIVHFSFGFFISYLAFECFIQYFNIKIKHAMWYAIEAMFSLGTVFEMLEWGVASFTSPSTSSTYVATQGDIWDAHKDIAWAFVGACLMMCIVYYVSIKKNKINIEQSI